MPAWAMQICVARKAASCGATSPPPPHPVHRVGVLWRLAVLLPPHTCCLPLSLLLLYLSSTWAAFPLLTTPPSVCSWSLVLPQHLQAVHALCQASFHHVMLLCAPWVWHRAAWDTPVVAL